VANLAWSAIRRGDLAAAENRLAAALAPQRAMHAVRAERPEPRFWAGFILVGAAN